MKIMLTGGGTLGPVTPLLALVEQWRRQHVTADMVWVGTVRGPEGACVAAENIRFISIASVKIPRYVTWYWVVVPFLLVYACVEAWNLLRAERPDVIVSAGGYVSVPLVVLGRCMGIRSWVHQQDVTAGLANKIMARFAHKVSVTFESSKGAFPARKTQVTGNAVRPSILEGSRDRAAKRFGLDPQKKTLFVLGGGTGSEWMNVSVRAIAADVAREWQVLHITGSGKYEGMASPISGYVTEPMILDGMKDAYALADVVLCRAGLGTLTELAALGKAAIVVPIPSSHQEMNAFFLYEHQAALVLDQTETTPQILLSAIKTVMKSDDIPLRFAANLKLAFPKDGTERVAQGVLDLAQEANVEWKRGVDEATPVQTFLGEKRLSKTDKEATTTHATTDAPLDAEASDLPLSIREQVARALSVDE